MLDLSTFKIGQPYGLTELRSFLLVGGYPQTPKSKAKSRAKSKAGSLQKTSFFSVAFCFKSTGVACAIFTRMHDSAALTIEPGGASPGQSALRSLTSKASNQGDGAASTITGILIDLQGM